MTSVWPALCSPWKRTTMSACSDSQSTILPLPSSPHWEPTTTTLAIRCASFRPEITANRQRLVQAEALPALTDDAASGKAACGGQALPVGRSATVRPTPLPGLVQPESPTNRLSPRHSRGDIGAAAPD